MTQTELDAAGIYDPMLRTSYLHCRDLNAQSGRTFFLATRLLAPAQRPAVHALYGFARQADDILDDFDPNISTAERAARLDQLATQLFDGSDHRDHPVLAAVIHTAHTYGMPAALFHDFITSMQMDLSITDYPDRPALNLYMRGSAEAIGLQMLPVLGTVVPIEQAAPYAEALGRAFQLTNFLRERRPGTWTGISARRRAGFARRRPGHPAVVPPAPPDRPAGPARPGRPTLHHPRGLPGRAGRRRPAG
jgi:phytoene synthase